MELFQFTWLWLKSEWNIVLSSGSGTKHEMSAGKVALLPVGQMQTEVLNPTES